MKLAILLVTCHGSPRVTTLTKAWFESATAQVRRFVEDQSGGRSSFQFRVFDWTALSFNTAQWIAEGTVVGNRVRPEVAAFHDADLAGFDRFAIVVDQAESRLAATFGTDVLMAAQDFTPAILAHELGHAFGAIHTRLDTADGPVEYGGPFCIMGAEGGKHSFEDATLVLPGQGGAPAHAASGPGMCVPSLLSAGWLDLGQHAVGSAGYADGLHGTTVRIAALDGAPPPGAAGLPVCCYIDSGDRYLVEYRVPQSRWDAGLPAADRQPAGGWIVVNRTPAEGAVQSLQVAAMAASPGNSVALGPDHPVAIFDAGPLRISVMAFDGAQRTVDLRISRRKGRVPQYETPFGGVTVDGGGLVWTPGGGFRRVPPRSPLLEVLEGLSRLEALRELASVGGARHRADITRAAEAELGSLRDAVAQVSLEAPEGAGEALLGEVRRLQQVHTLDGAALEEHLARLRALAQRMAETE